jgi:hypothetical protein
VRSTLSTTTLITRHQRAGILSNWRATNCFHRVNCKALLNYKAPPCFNHRSRSRRFQHFYLRAAISDCLLIGFIRATETLRKNWNTQFDIGIDDF